MNKVILVGRLTRDPEVRYSQGENTMAIARYTIAVNRRFKREGDPEADFIRCVVFGRAAEFAESMAEREHTQTPASAPESSGDGFMNIPEGIDEELPFH